MVRLKLSTRERRHEVAGHLPALTQRMLGRGRLIASARIRNQGTVPDRPQRLVAPHLEILVHGEPVVAAFRARHFNRADERRGSDTGRPDERTGVQLAPVLNTHATRFVIISCSS